MTRRRKSKQSTKHSVFISHSSVDKPFAMALVQALQNADLAPWIDRDRVLVGTSILDEIGKGLALMDLFVLIVSDAAIKSGWVQKEAEFAAYREVTEKKTLILPFIIDETVISDLPWHLRMRNVGSIRPNQAGVDQVVAVVRQNLQTRASMKDKKPDSRFRPVPEVETLIKGRELGDWDAAETDALAVLAQTDPDGINGLFRALLTYKDAPDQETVMNALAIAEMCIAIAPWVVDRAAIVELAGHPDFTVRASAASMCMEIANVAPGLVPTDILLTLSRFNEDWYVQAPANAALKTMAHAMPGVLRIFIERLDSEDRDEREHAAAQLFDISKEEPEALNKEVLMVTLARLKKRKDKNATDLVAKTLSNAKKTSRQPKYRYGL